MATGKVSVKFGKGTAKIAPKGGTGSSRQALSQLIAAELKKSGITRELAEKEGMKKRQEVASMAKSYFEATVKGSLALVNNSGVAAVYDPDSTPNPKHESFRRKDFIKRGRVRQKGSGTYFTPTIRQTRTLIRDANTPAGMVDQVTVVVTNPGGKGWKKLTERYALRSPKSKQFFHKRESEASARRAFLIEALKLSPKLTRTSSFYKGTVRIVPGKTEGSWVSEFRISYPALGPKFEFLRRAFLSGMSNISVVSGKDSFEELGSTGVDGILRAERYRPLMRPYSSEMGRKFKTALSQMEKKRSES